MDRFEEYKKAYSEARQADLDKNYRSAADNFWEAMRLASDEDWTSMYRLYCLQNYVHYLWRNLIVPTKNDYKNLETHTVNNENEPNIFRANAALCLGIMYFNDKKDYEEAAECFRRCIDFCDSASPEEKERVDENVTLAGGPPRARQHREVFDGVKEVAVKFLRRMESCEVEDSAAVQDPVRSPWFVFPRVMLVPVFGDIPTELMERRMASGGATCDCCGIARGSTDRVRLLVCGKCKMAYYCSKECQVEQWKRGGHKLACRKPREFHPDDIVRCVYDKGAAVFRLKCVVDGTEGDDSRKWDAYCGTKDAEPIAIRVESLGCIMSGLLTLSSAICG